MKIFKLLLTGVYFFFITTILFSQTINPNSDGIVYVKGDILLPGDGSSWANAVTELSDALEASRSNPNIKEIWITSGTYIPQNIVSGGSEERDKSFVLPAGVKIYGGFAGLETDLSQRDSETNKTILNGAFTNSSFLPDSVYHVVLATGDMNGAVLDGVTITGGKADELGFITHNSYRITKNYGGGVYLHNISNFTLANIAVEKNSSDNNGGGMYLNSSSPDIQEVTIQNNTSRNGVGGGIYLSESYPDMQDIRILNNYAGYTGGGMHLSTSNPDMRRVTIQYNTANTNGGGMYLQSSTPATMQDIDIQYNTATASGGGMYLNSSSDPQIEQFKIDNNTARSGGGIYNSSSSPTMKFGSISDNIYGTENNSMGGGMYNASSSPSITDIIISGNKLADATKLLISGGGIYNYNSSPVITNVIISNNTAVYSGGGVSNAGASSAPEFTNVLFTGNKVTQAGGQGGAMNTSHTTPDITFTMTNVTISNNTADQGSALYNSNVTGAEIRNSIIWENGNGINNIYNALSTDLTHKHSLIQGSYGGATWNTSVGTDGGNNIASDPKFVDAASGDYTLDISSPAINKGHNDHISGITTDLAGNDRIYGRSVDMGPYEFQSDPVLPDHNGILYVAADGTGVGNSWDNAFPGLADALLYAESIPEIKQLWLKAGTYTPAYIAGNGTEEKDMAFVLPAGIKIYGGFAGTETDLADRDLTVNKTILSGVFTNNIQQADNVYHVVVATGDMQDAVLDAVTITGGKATGTFTSVTIHSKNVYKNYGGGIYLQETSNLTISNVSVTGNQSNTYGGGIYLNLAEATLKNIRVEGNASLSGYGGGICNNASSPVITHAIITDNTANYFGGGIHSLGDTSHFTLTNILFARNTASRGGGMYTAAGIFEMTNATVTGNEATGDGNPGGGLYNIGATGSSVKNTIIWNNGTKNITKTANDYTEYFHSLIENGYTNTLWNTNIGIDGGNNIASDPLFTDPASGDYTLSVYSPAVDKGNNSYIAGIDIDLAGNSRIYGSGQVDMGAYELQSLPPGPDNNGILYVSETGDGTQLGNSWDNALPGLATALLVGSTNPDVKEIRIKAGTYTPEYAFGNGTQERDKTFFLPAGIKIYGGFDGSEITPEDRDYETNKVILSGVTGTTGTVADSVYHVVVAVGDMNGACLDGVTITGGNGGTGNVSLNGLNVSRSNGSGICIQQVSGFSLANISVTGNYGAGFGGGIYIGNTTDISLTNMTVDNNYSGNNGGGIYMSTISGLTLSDLTVKDNRINNGSGGGIYMTDITYSVFSNVTVNRNISPVSAGGILLSNSDSTLVIDNLEIKENNGSRGAGIYLSNSSPVMKSIRITDNILRPANPTRGGGIYFTNSSSPEITDLILTGNRLEDGTITDTGMRGGGIYNENSSPVITNAIIKDNSCGYTGGGINSTGASSNPKLINVLITGNTLTHSGTFGGGIMSENGELELINVTISGNTSTYGSGLYNNGSTKIDIKNSIIWDNGTGTNNVGLLNPNNATNFYHSLIQRAHAADGTWDAATGIDHGGNTSQDPLFTDPASGDYTLTIYSPAVNKGNKDYLAGILTDLAGNTRIYGNDPDMGAYELQQQAAGPDVNGILYISEDGDGTKTGSSWNDAFPGLANALKFAETNSTITQLWIKAGTYVPIHLAGNGDLEQDKTFMLPAGVEIYGGFDGTESTPDTRDTETNKTILNGAFINAQSQPDSVYHVVTAIGDMAGTILDGVTITGGKATGSSSVMVDGDSNKRIYRNYGGGIYLHQVTNLIFSGIQIKENKAFTYGGGIYMSDSDPTLTNVEITNNLLTYSTSYGGGMYLQNSSPAIEHTTINKNIALYGGGGMHLNTNSDPIMEYVEIDANSARMGGGMYINSSSPVMSFVSITNNIYGTTGSSYGGGIYNNNSTLEMTNMLISGNYYSDQAATSNMYGGGIYNNGSTSSITINKSIIKDNEARAGGGIYNNNATSLITNTEITNNTAKTSSGGGGIYNLGVNAHTSLTNVLLAENKTTAAMTGGGAIYNNQGTAEIINTTISGHHTAWYVITNTATMEIKNSIIWGNTAMALINNGATGTIDFYNSLIEGAYDADGTWKTTFGTDNGSNIAYDPMFTDATTGDYTLTIYSPAIGKGNNSYIMGYLTDLAGNDRIYGGNVDMGAYELHSQPAGPDSNGILYISETGDGEKRGNNWEDAFPGLANALEFAEANPDVKQLWLKAGTYVPEKLTNPNNQTASDKSFYLIKDMQLYGGFAGTETSPADREPGNNPTILSGVIGNSGAATDSVYHVVTAAGDMGSALIDGVIITGGRAYGNSSNRNGYGGGVYLNEASGLTISNTIITRNYARYNGGGIYNHMSSVTFKNVTLSHNEARQYGGGMTVFAGTAVITNSNFNHNTSYSSGGALCFQTNSTGTITGTRFTENTATGSTAMGGAIYLAESSPLINRVLIKDNTATYRGGGIYTGTGANPTIVNTIITGNTSNQGGAMGIASEPTLTNVTMTTNTALDRGGAMYNTTGSNPRTRNSIIWNNKSRRDGAIYNLVAGSGTGQATFEYTLLQDAFDASGNWNSANGNNAGNNTGADPRFTDPEAEDFHLVQLSPARNKGNNTYYAAGSTPDIQSCIYDYEGNDRFHNHGVVDLGAYEAQWNTWLEIKVKTVAYNGQPHSVDSVFVKEYTDRQLVSIGEKSWVQYQYFNENGQKLTQLPVSPGTYDVIASFSGHSHYEAMQSDTVQLTIQKASIHLTLNSETQTYTGEPLHISPAIITGNVGTVPAITYTYTKDNISTDHALGAGIYTVTASFAGDNYHEALTSDPVTFEVEKARPVIHITFSGKEYDGTPVEINQPTLTGSTTVHTLLPDLTYSYINSDNTYGPTPVPPTDAGEYTLTISTSGDANHKAAQTQGSFTIGNNIPAITLASRQVTYNGQPVEVSDATIQPAGAQHLTIKYKYAGILKDGTAYPETENAPTDAGDYTVTAWTEGDYNYASISTTAALEIRKKQTGIIMQSKSAPYTGKPISIDDPVADPAGIPLLITYQGQGATTYNETAEPPVDKGNYLVTATWGGDNNYTAATATANLTIAETGALQLSLSNKTAIYNGQPIAINNAVIEPAEAQYLPVKYKYAGILRNGTAYPETENAPVDAGIYTVTAWTEGDQTYGSVSTTATLEITQKQPVILMQHKNAPYTGNPISIDDPVTDPAGITLNITYKGQGTTTYRETANPPVEKGTYLVTATWEGDNNHTAATATANLTITDQDALRITLSSKTATYNGQPVVIDNAVIEPAEAQYLPVRYKYTGTLYDGTLYPETENAPVDAGTYTVTARTDGDNTYGSVSTTATLEIKQKQPGITLQNKSTPYTGNAISIDDPVTDPAGIVLSVTYKGQGTTTYYETAAPPVEPGTYLVTASYEGDNNHTAKTATANLTITREGSLRLSLNNRTVTYTGQPVVVDDAVIEPAEAQSLTIRYNYAGTLYDGTIYPETETAPVDAGNYTVTAWTDGDQTYGAVSTTATLEITKKQSIIIMVNKSVTYTGSPVPIDDPVTDPAGITLSVTYKGQGATTYYETATPPVEPGTYLATAMYEGNNNYTSATTTANLTITNDGPVTPVLTLTDKIVSYNGTAQSVTATISPSGAQYLEINYKYAGALHDGTLYPETENPPVDAGEYTVTAWTDGDQIYNPASTTATLRITQKQPVITLVNKTVPYTGEAISIDDPVTDPADIPLTITYKGQGETIYQETAEPPVETGTYLVTATWEGDNNHTAGTATANLTIIANAVSPQLTLSNKTVTYNGAAQSIGEVIISPEEAQYLEVRYQYSNAGYGPSETPPTDAGVYTVTASTLADEKFTAASVTATLTIEKADQVMTFPAIPDKQTGDEPFKVGVTVDTGLPVTYESGNPYVASITDDGTITIHRTGTVTITAKQAGNNNYNEVFRTQVLTITSNDTRILSLTVNGEAITIGENMYYDLGCSDLSDIPVVITTEEDATVDTGKSFTVTVDKPMLKTVQFTVTSQDGKANKTYTLMIEKRFDFDAIVKIRWNNTLTVINNSNFNGGYTFTSFKWYRNGEELTDHQSWSAGNNGEELDPSDIFYVEVTANEFEGTLRTCEGSPVLSSNRVTVYPNPVEAGSEIVVDADIDETFLEGATIDIYSMSGNRIKNVPVTGQKTTFRFDVASGTYMFKLNGANDFTHETKIIVK